MNLWVGWVDVVDYLGRCCRLVGWMLSDGWLDLARWLRRCVVLQAMCPGDKLATTEAQVTHWGDLPPSLCLTSPR